MKYTTICKALYDYEPQTDEEVSFKEDDILYILENDDPDWWKAQLKTTSLDQVGPVGLVPSNYIDEAEPIGTVKAIFDYQAQQEEELSFHEDDILVLYENDDPDWFLVKSREGHIGLAPSNYIETISSDLGAKTNPTEQPSHEQEPAVSVFSAITNTPASPLPNTTKDEAVSWSVHEYDPEKKKKTKNKGNLFIGNGMFCYGSETDKSSPVRQFSILDITDYGQDGKNVHVEIGDSANSIFDFQTSSKSEAKSILAKLDDSRAIANQHRSATTPSVPSPTMTQPPAPANVEPEPEQPPPPPPCEPRWAIVLYDFDAQGEDELTVKEQEQVLITDYVSSNEWWTVEHQDGRSGIVPTTYVKFHEDYEADLANEQDETRRQQEQQQEQQQREAAAAAARQRRLDEEEAERKKREQQDQLEKERARQVEAERRRKMQEEAKQRELDAKRAAARAAAAANSPQIPAASPRRSQIPAPLPPTAKSSAAKSLPTDQTVHSISVPTNRSLPDRPKQAHDSGKPDPAKVRTWTDRTGAFKVEAQFVACNNGKIRLHKINGVKIDVPVQKMCTDDLHYIEQETGARLLEDKTDNIPLAHLTNNSNNDDGGFTWFDYFTKINIPSKNGLQYAAAFQQEGLGEKDIDHLTHRKMKSLGMTEKHVQRLQRYLETQVAEPPSDDEDGMGKKRKKSVTFGITSFIEDDDNGDYGGADQDAQRRRQIEEDERFARQLQLQENDTTRTNLHRRGTGRPTPSTSAPKDMNAQIMDKIKSQLGSEPLKPSPISPSKQPASLQPSSSVPPAPLQPSSSAPPPPAPPLSNQSTGFQDDAWTNRASGSSTNPPANNQPATQWASNPTVPSAPPSWTNNTNNHTTSSSPAAVSAQLNLQAPTFTQSTSPMIQQQQQQISPSPIQQQTAPPVVPLPPRQRPTPQVSQTNQVNPQLLAQWTNGTPSPQQQQPAAVPAQHQPVLPPRSPNMLMQSQQTGYGQQLGYIQQSPQQAGFAQPQMGYPQQQQTGYMQPQQTFLQPTMQPQGTAMNVPVSSVLPPPLVPTSTPLKPQPTGRNWTSATPDNPFGNGPSHQPPTTMTQQGSPANLQPAQVFASMTGNQTNMAPPQNPNDPYAVFKNMNPQGPSVFNQQQQAQQTGFMQPQQTGLMQPQQTGFMQPQQTGFVPQQTFYGNNNGWR
ncbi:hypothetical protein BC941DRAFT_369299 [Chlamydoabsidia padenii]|nr:hypothetical protein BC941DRAFT_369299 [Chlamydoabsidia padenii]